MRTLGQKRAEFALEKISQISKDKKDRFKPFSAGAPSMILQNGFGQALAFWVSKGKDEHIAMFTIIKEWLSYKRDDVQNKFMRETASTAEFLDAISKMQQSEYMSAQKETLALLEWVKRFANAGL